MFSKLQSPRLSAFSISLPFLYYLLIWKSWSNCKSCQVDWASAIMEVCYMPLTKCLGSQHCSIGIASYYYCTCLIFSRAVQLLMPTRSIVGMDCQPCLPAITSCVSFSSPDFFIPYQVSVRKDFNHLLALFKWFHSSIPSNTKPSICILPDALLAVSFNWRR